MPTASGQVRLDDLIRVCSSNGEINTGLLQEMLHLFIRDNARRVHNAVAAARNGDATTLREEVHAVKGSAALIGADALRDLAGDLEMRILSGTARDPQTSALQLSAEYDAVVSTLQALYPDLRAG